jgi:hypothetical protein
LSRELTPPDDTVMLAALLQSHIEGVRTDSFVEQSLSYSDIEDLVPASLIARASIALTGETDIQIATEKLLTDPELKKRVINDVADLVSGAGAVSTMLTQLREAKKNASANNLPIELMRVGEPYTLEYRSRFRCAQLVVMRDKSGDDNDSLSLTIAEQRGAIIHSGFNRLRSGLVTYLGYCSSRSVHTSALQRGASPAWTPKIYKNDEGKWVCKALKTDKSFRLQQVYMGEDDAHPLF